MWTMTGVARNGRDENRGKRKERRENRKERNRGGGGLHAHRGSVKSV